MQVGHASSEQQPLHSEGQRDLDTKEAGEGTPQKHLPNLGNINISMLYNSLIQYQVNSFKIYWKSTLHYQTWDSKFD